RATGTLCTAAVRSSTLRFSTSLSSLRELRLGEPGRALDWRSERRLPRRSPKGEGGPGSISLFPIVQPAGRPAVTRSIQVRILVGEPIRGGRLRQDPCPSSKVIGVQVPVAAPFKASNGLAFAIMRT